MQSFKMIFSGVTILQGVEFPIFPIDFAWALQQCSATALPVIFRFSLPKVSFLVIFGSCTEVFNWKFLDLLEKCMEEEHILSKLINMCSCGLHVVHGAFQSGHKASGWSVNAYLRAMFGTFKDSPACRADFCAITGKKTFPLKFCQVRWVENVTVAQRALELLPDICQYVSKTGTVTCENLKALCSDKLASAKISFFASVASVCEPFLKQYQTAEPMAPFMYDDMEHLLRQLMKRFVKKSLIKEADSVAKLVKIDVFCKDHWCSYRG